MFWGFWKRALQEYEPAHFDELGSKPPVSAYAGYKRYSLFSPAEWLLELGTLLLSLALFVVLVVILWFVHDKPLSEWQFRISLNTVVSIMTTGCSAAMMHGVSEFIGLHKLLHFKQKPRKLADFERFDGASRGPWGSTRFIFGVKWNLATVGALITIGRLAFAPLAQQVVQYPERMINTIDAGATFGYTYGYNRKLVHAAELFDISMLQDTKMQSAILQGIYDIDVTPLFTCPDACVWDESYISLGFKTSCNNVTAITLHTEACTDESCSMITPGGLNLTAHSFHLEDGGSQSIFLLTSAIPQHFNASELVRYAVYRATANGITDNSYPCNINITECIVGVTAYEYSQVHANGSEFKFDSIKEISLQDVHWYIDNSSLVYYTNQSATPGLPGFNFSDWDFRALQSYFASNTISSEWVVGDYNKEVSGGISAALVGDVDLEQRFQKMAASMTDYIRSGPNKQIAKGMRVTRVTFVSIKWLWLIGPAIIELATLIFACTTIFRNRKSRGVPLWKSSALAVLACHYEGGPGIKAGLIRNMQKDVNEIENTA
ncbi:hypothetical protein K461DRAFT_292205 [Myriangium duriaei CBS 260.36]|uniref:Uncharacterized protein n=1 Tax=Myriangium duriaei CBS 260.36 TaxID=1168546 RepID=A0A9P4J5S6_9PEZI|nr:hypothetical protein K461DRAFT_292205 [Myriangium duriaei CBS 260.36]